MVYSDPKVQQNKSESDINPYRLIRCDGRSVLLLPAAVFEAWDAELEVWLGAQHTVWRGRSGPESRIRLSR